MTHAINNEQEAKEFLERIHTEASESGDVEESATELLQGIGWSEDEATAAATLLAWCAGNEGWQFLMKPNLENAALALQKSGIVAGESLLVAYEILNDIDLEFGREG